MTITTGVKPLSPARIPVVRARALADALPAFPDAQAYKNHVVKLVGQTIVAERELDAARKNGTAAPTVAALEERLSALRLQLTVLRDHFAVPSAWTRPGLAFGEGFDKAAFWREQGAALAAGVASTPAPAPVASAPPMQRFSEALEKAWFKLGAIAEKAFFYGACGFLVGVIVVCVGVNPAWAFGLCMGVPIAVGSLIAAGKS